MGDRRVLFHPDSFASGPQPIGPRPVNSGVAPIGPKPVGGGGAGLQPIGPRPVTSAPAPAPESQEETASKIRAIEQRLGAGTGRIEESWKRPPSVTGQGASHCKSFHCKLTGDSLENLDRQINEWLDAHPQYEVKFVTTSVGEWLGKLREPNLIVQVWV
jgi:hypothetical protein